MTRWSEAKASVDMSRNSQDINLQLPMRVSCVMPPLLCGEVRAEVAKPSIDPSLPLLHYSLKGIRSIKDSAQQANKS